MRRFAVGGGPRLDGFIFISAEYSRSADGDGPGIGDAKIDTAENRVGLDPDLLEFGAGFVQIDPDASEDGQDIAAFKFLRIDPPPDAAEKRPFVQAVL
jgi:hypothetical protein